MDGKTSLYQPRADYRDVRIVFILGAKGKVKNAEQKSKKKKKLQAGELGSAIVIYGDDGNNFSRLPLFSFSAEK